MNKNLAFASKKLTARRISKITGLFAGSMLGNRDKIHGEEKIQKRSLLEKANSELCCSEFRSERVALSVDLFSKTLALMAMPTKTIHQRLSVGLLFLMYLCIRSVLFI